MSLLSSSEGPSKYRPLYAFLLLTLGVGALASLATVPSIPTWYASLGKPWFNPPNGLFAPVWTALYIMMAVAAWRVWRVQQDRPTAPSREAQEGEVSASARARGGRRGSINLEMVVFALQLAFNGAWSFVFFYAHRIGAAAIELGALMVLILATLILFWRRDHWAGILFLPYLAWTGFALLLNVAIWRLNSP